MEIVKTHDYTRDAQQVFADLVAHYTTFIAASTRAQVLFEKITVNTIPETQRESLEKYITTFKDWVHEYNLISTDKLNNDSQLVQLTGIKLWCGTPHHF
jgi:Cys-tRNA synthase (O-phospho-L-seryl-tRNA:Cys-tRNA synthase)